MTKHTPPPTHEICTDCTYAVAKTRSLRCALHDHKPISPRQPACGAYWPRPGQRIKEYDR